MKIKEVVKVTGLTDRAVRHYIDEGLLFPSYEENYAGRKSFDFSDEDIIILKKIVIYRRAGISVSDIISVFNNELTLAQALEKTVNKLDNEYDNINASMYIGYDLLHGNYTNENLDINKFWNNNYNADPLKEVTKKSISNLKLAIGLSVFMCICLVLNSIIDYLNGELTQKAEIVFHIVLDTIGIITLSVFIYYCASSLKEISKK